VETALRRSAAAIGSAQDGRVGKNAGWLTVTAAQAAGIGLFTGVFKKVTGSYTFDPKNPRADKADNTIPVDGLDTFFPMRDEDLKSAAFFDAKANPDIHFVSTK